MGSLGTNVSLVLRPDTDEFDQTAGTRLPEVGDVASGRRIDGDRPGLPRPDVPPIGSSAFHFGLLPWSLLTGLAAGTNQSKEATDDAIAAAKRNSH
jgi:hypothetical protein